METTGQSNIAEIGKRERRGLTASQLKWIAIIAMLIDHIAYAFVKPDTSLFTAMDFIGKITGPTMFYFLVEGYHHTRNVNRYMIRLATFATVSYVPFICCFYDGLPNKDNFYHMNVIYTILLGLLALRARNEIRIPILRYLAIALIFIASLIGDWYYMAILIILVFDYFRGNFKQQVVGYLLVITLSDFSILYSCLSPFNSYINGYGFDMSYLTSNLSSFGALIPIILLAFYNGKRGSNGQLSKWGFYIFYPSHLAILGLLKYIQR